MEILGGKKIVTSSLSSIPWTMFNIRGSNVSSFTIEFNSPMMMMWTDRSFFFFFWLNCKIMYFDKKNCWHNSIPCSEECFEVFLVTNCLNSFSNLCLIFCLIRNVPNNHLFVRDLQIKISAKVFKVPLFYIWKKRISMPPIIEW